MEWLQEQDRLREKSSAKTPVDDSEEAKARRKEESKKRRFEAKLRAEQPAQAPAEEVKDEKPSHNAPTDVRPTTHTHRRTHGTARSHSVVVM